MRFPVDPDTATWHFAAGRRRPAPASEWSRLLRALQRRRLRRRRLDRARGSAPRRRVRHPRLAAGAAGRRWTSRRRPDERHPSRRRPPLRRLESPPSRTCCTRPRRWPTTPAAVCWMRSRSWATAQNEVARSLKRQATRTLGISIPDALNPFHATAGARGRAAAPTATASRCWWPRPRTIPETRRRQVRALVGRRVDGVIFPAVTARLGDPQRACSTAASRWWWCRSRARRRRGWARSWSTNRRRWTSWSATCVELGHRRIAFAHSRRPTRSRSTPAPRRCGAALARRGLEPAADVAAATAVCCTNDVDRDRR